MINVGIFAHGGYDMFGIRYSKLDKKSDNHLLYINLIEQLHKWEECGLMSVSFFCCNSGRPRTSFFASLSNIFPAVIFVGFATPITRHEILASKVQLLLEYFALHSVLVDETHMQKETALKLRRDIVEVAKKKMREKADASSRVNDLVFFNSKLQHLLQDTKSLFELNSRYLLAIACAI